MILRNKQKHEMKLCDIIGICFYAVTVNSNHRVIWV